MEKNNISGSKTISRPNPREKASIFSYILFIWLLPLFFKGWKKVLDFSDLYDPLTKHRSKLLGDLLCKSWNQEIAAKKAKGPSLLKAGLRVFGKQLILGGLMLLFLEICVRMLQPLFLLGFISYFSDSSDSDTTKAYWYAAGIILCSTINVLLIHPIMLSQSHLGMKMRIAAISMIYRKTLCLTKTALGETTAGQVVNLLSNDVGRFETSILFIHYLWIAPIELIIVSVILFQMIQSSAFVGVGFLFVFVPIQVYLGKIGATLRLKTALKTDERVRFMNEILQGIQVIKMYAWEPSFSVVVNAVRRKEIRVIRLVSYIRGCLLSFMMFTSRVSIFSSLATYVLLGQLLDAKTAFVVTAYFNLLRNSMTMLFPQGIYQLAETLVSVSRIQKFMMYEEIDPAQLPSNLGTSEKIAESGKIRMQKVHAKWQKDITEDTLSDINLNFESNTLVAVIGPVGSGKSSLMQAILGELKISEGEINISGSVSYASQEPWLFSSSIRQNILFGQPYDRDRYRNVVRACSLERDFSLFTSGDKTIVGERGASLSGGQKARINLARAVYRKAAIYLLDDPLSAVDTHVGQNLFNNCIKTLLKDSITFLATHQIQYLEDTDTIILLEKGKVSSMGDFNHLSNSGLDFTKLLESVETNQEEPKEACEDHDSSLALIESAKRESLLSLKSIQSVVATNQETQDEGSISLKVYKSYFEAAGGWCTFISVFLLFVLAQVLASSSDYYLMYWVDKNEKAALDLKTTGIWSDFTEDKYFDIYMFGVLTILTVIISFTRTFVFFNAAMKASQTLHQDMFKGVSTAAMYFFHINPSGRVLNRFSKDMGQVDEILPAILIDMIQIFLQLIAIIVLLMIVNPFFTILTLLIVGLFMFFRKFYLKTSTSIKRMEAVTRSPIYTHLNASINGLATIRSCKAEEILIAEFDKHQDFHSSAYYLFIAAARAFGFWLDFTCVIYIALITLSFFIMENTGGNVGLAITQVIGMTGMVQWGMRQSAELENTMTSVERINEYKSIEAETSPDKNVRESWPENGEIVFENLSLSYVPDKNVKPVLKNLSFEIKPREKVGVVGRTGAGKSSLINALFRLSYTEGSIYIDQIDTQNLPLGKLRQNISIIPQEPVLFSGTLRYNLDPFDEYTDQKIWQALEEVKLGQVVKDLPAGLSSTIIEGGQNFSVGQRQLVCLARAILKENNILVMDEATANVDPQTDTLIQTTIRTKFSQCTVLTIAHRLNTIIDSDKVLVMEAGSCIEFGSPHDLLTNPDASGGHFYKMAESNGQAALSKFLETARAKEASRSD